MQYSGQITLKRAGADGVYVDFDTFMSAADSGEPILQRQMTILDIVLRAQAASVCKMVGDAFYDEALENRQRPWSQKFPIANRLAQLWLGYRTATVYTEKGPMLQVRP